MKVIRTDLPGVLLLEPKVFEDARGAVFESYNRRAFAQATGADVEFVQDNHSHSKKNVLRGLHYQVVRPQGKLIRVLHGEIFDVAVDLRRSSPTFGKWVGFNLSDKDNRMACYKMTDFWSPEHERTVAWNDPQIAVRWPLEGEPVLSGKDKAGKRLAEAELFA